jgi:hypothetical protein
MHIYSVSIKEKARSVKVFESYEAEASPLLGGEDLVMMMMIMFMMMIIVCLDDLNTLLWLAVIY